MGIADGAAIQHEGPCGLRQLAAGDRRRGFRRIEGNREIDLAVVEQADQRRAVLRPHLAAAPQMRREGIQVSPHRPGHRIEIVARRALQDRRVRRGLEDHLLQEGRADEIRRRGIGDAARIGFRMRQNAGDAARRRRQRGAVVNEVELCHAPGCLEPVGRYREVEPRRRLVLDIDIAKIRQVLGEGAEQQPLVLHRLEILAVDPDQVDRAAVVPAGRLLGQYPADRFRRVRQFHLPQRHAVVFLDPVATQAM